MDELFSETTPGQRNRRVSTVNIRSPIPLKSTNNLSPMMLPPFRSCKSSPVKTHGLPLERSLFEEFNQGQKPSNPFQEMYLTPLATYSPY